MCNSVEKFIAYATNNKYRNEFLSFPYVDLQNNLRIFTFSLLEPPSDSKMMIKNLVSLFIFDVKQGNISKEKINIKHDEFLINIQKIGRKEFINMKEELYSCLNCFIKNQSEDYLKNYLSIIKKIVNLDFENIYKLLNARWEE